MDAYTSRDAQAYSSAGACEGTSQGSKPDFSSPIASKINGSRGQELETKLNNVMLMAMRHSIVQRNNSVCAHT